MIILRIVLREVTVFLLDTNQFFVLLLVVPFLAGLHAKLLGNKIVAKRAFFKALRQFFATLYFVLARGYIYDTFLDVFTSYVQPRRTRGLTF